MQVGSRNEPEPGRSGFAHFFEHLMLRGTPANPPEKFRAVMSKAGARDNAGTGDDFTHFYATFSKEYLEQVIALYADTFQHLSVSEADFKTEARAILGEYNKNAADPVRKLFEVQRDHFYQVHTYKHTVMGFVADIENMPNEYEYSKLFFKRWYRPQYTTVVVAGDVTAAQVLPLVEKYWGSWKADRTPPVEIPKDPAPQGPIYAHVPWTGETLPYLAVAFPLPAFVETSKEFAAMQLVGDMYFGPTSALYKELVVKEQSVDLLDTDVPTNVDASLFTVLARVKRPSDVAHVRNEILATVAAARLSDVPADRLADAKGHTRYAFVRGLDSTERITGIVASSASVRRSYDTVNAYYRTLASIGASDLQAAARRSFTDAGLIVTTLSTEALGTEVEQTPRLDSVQPADAWTSNGPDVPKISPRTTAAGDGQLRVLLQKSVMPQLDIKLTFSVGSSHDPAGKEGLAALTAAMIAKGGSAALTIDQIDAALYPIAGSFDARADKEMTTFTASVHRDHWVEFLDTVLPQLVAPGFRPDDFTRLKAMQLAALTQDLRSSNEEELGKERLQTNLFRDTPYGHVALGTVAGLDAIALEDVKQFARTMYTRMNLTVGISGDVPDQMVPTLTGGMAALPAGPLAARVAIAPKKPSGIDVEIIAKDTRSTAISFGFPIDVTRANPDFAALSVARVWLGEHRISSGQLYQRIREVRGFNYGDYAYIEAFPRGMFQFYPDPNIVRQRQLFEIWIRPVVPDNGQMALRIAIYELGQLIENGLTKAEFETTRDYLMNNVYVMTARQDQQLGYAIDSRWYGAGEFTASMRRSLAGLTVDQVNAAIRRHLTARDLSVVCITKDAEGLKRALVSDDFSPVHYDGDKPADVLAEDNVIGTLRLNIPAEHVTITPVGDVFAK